MAQLAASRLSHFESFPLDVGNAVVCTDSSFQHPRCRQRGFGRSADGVPDLLFRPFDHADAVVWKLPKWLAVFSAEQRSAPSCPTAGGGVLVRRFLFSVAAVSDSVSVTVGVRRFFR